MLRLTVRTQTPREVVLAVDGRVAGDNVQLLKREGERCQQEAPRLVLDLEGVQSIDEAGLALLRTWSGSGLVLHGGAGVPARPAGGRGPERELNAFSVFASRTLVGLNLGLDHVDVQHGGDAHRRGVAVAENVT